MSDRSSIDYSAASIENVPFIDRVHPTLFDGELDLTESGVAKQLDALRTFYPTIDIVLVKGDPDGSGE